MTTSTLIKVGSVEDFPLHLGTCVKIGEQQIAIFRLPTLQTWYAVQNLNPQNQRMVLSRGITGDENGTPFVACPLHKHRYNLESGECLSDPSISLQTFVVKEEGGLIYLEA
ncbi:nitrite reductase (NADH) small subunit [Rubritalea squalenifaciens DSM 18772]|uniref:Nitrite reductase (NADH) small subunit n=2 Tax=Rubritalea TaxID=361050 RepID=A0A1M6NT53_9BACT|nr:nitrite reductase small subunit NirD [Rubritalea squalenifaciens]SHJ98772.1 nitrite reductase (NADH) small subunit [Rubritalea squalenifaciens DSM 18772]